MCRRMIRGSVGAISSRFCPQVVDILRAVLVRSKRRSPIERRSPVERLGSCQACLRRGSR